MTSDEIIETMARALDREEAAQMGEPSPWDVFKNELEHEWISERFACVRAALSAAEAAGWVMVPAAPTEAMIAAAQTCTAPYNIYVIFAAMLAAAGEPE